MKLATTSFRGEVPLVTPRALPDNAAQLAKNARLQTGDLEAWRQFLLEKSLANGATVQTIYKLKDKWLSWVDQVDVARGLIPGDTTYLTYLTSPALYGSPQFTTYALATTGAEPYPVATRKLGVGAPLAAPTLVIGVDTSDAALFAVDVTDAGDKLGTDWTSYGGSPHLGDSNVTQVATGNPTPSYQVCFGNNAGVPAVMYRNFGVSTAAVIEMTLEFKFSPALGGNNYTQMVAKLANSATGAGVYVGWQRGGSFSIANSTGWNTTSASALATTTTTDTAYGVWYTLKITMQRNADNTQKVTALLKNGATVLATLVTTNSFTVGDYCGFLGETGYDDSDSGFFTFYDNIHVKASGTLGYAPTQTATSYLFTYRNDLGQESAPSPVTATILRPDGVSVTITTPTALPGGYSAYNITEKVIYRAVTGDGGTVFKQVTALPLATANYIDLLNDGSTGPHVLESSDWDLPPAGLQGIIALPNDCMAGFFANQLCFSAQGFPHAWPVKNRHTTDTDIVAICNIDTTVVVGTKSFVYTATGSSPDAYSMSKPGEAQSCVAKRSMVYLDGIGVVFASPDGWQRCAGSAGAVDNLTEKVFTRRQWQALNPASFIAVVHDSVLHWFYDNTPAPTGGPWLFFNPGDNTEPLCMNLGGDTASGSAIPFVNLVGCVNSDGGGNNEGNVVGTALRMPLFSVNAVPGPLEYSWAPASGSPVTPTINAGNPDPTNWPTATHWVDFSGFSNGQFIGWAGGILTLYTNNDATGASGRTVITFLASGFTYPPVSVQYVA